MTVAATRVEAVAANSPRHDTRRAAEPRLLRAVRMPLASLNVVRSLAHPKAAATVRATKFPAELRENLPEELLPMLEWEMDTVEQGAWQRSTVDAPKL